MKIGLVLEGGGMRGLFSAAVLDVLLEQRINVDTIVGVSAGALFGVNYSSAINVIWGFAVCSPRVIS